MKDNGMKLNIEKTHVILLGNASNIAKIGRISININGTLVQSSDKLTSLGLTIDPQLKWSHHINNISRNYHFVAKSLYPLKHLLSPQNFRKIFHACANSLLNYMSVRGQLPNLLFIYLNLLLLFIPKLESNIRGSARIILKKSKSEPIFEIYNTLNWLLPLDIHTYFTICFLYNVIVLNSYPFFQDLFKNRGDIHSHMTRARNATNCALTSSLVMTTVKKSIAFKGSNLWNQMY